MPGKQGGIDGVVSEAFHYLECESLEALRLSFEKCLNCESPHGETIEDWRKVLVRCAPKCAASHRLTQWRPTSLTNALSKWYLSYVTYLLRFNMSKPTASLLGFEPGRQCMEISEFTRLLLVRAQEWGLPVHVGKGDAHKAFDSIEHVTLDQALEMRGVPLALRCACLRELVDIVLIVSLQNTFSEPVELRKGGKQGGSETPTFWNVVLDHVMGPVVFERIKHRCGVDLGDGQGPISHLVWADDAFWFSADWEEFARMAQELTHPMNDGGLKWKQFSLCFMANQAARGKLPGTSYDKLVVLDRAGAPCIFPRVDQMLILGILMDD